MTLPRVSNDEKTMKKKSSPVILEAERFRASPMLIAACLVLAGADACPCHSAPPTFEAYLRKSVVDKKTIDVFLDPKQLSWAKFDPITGYRLGNYMPKDGVDRSATISTSQSNGMRT